MRHSPFSFSHLNLRWNPFSQLDAESWRELAVIEPLTCSPGSVTQLLGDAGHGKTTHLLALWSQNERAVYEYRPEGQTYFKTRVRAGMFFLLDEAQRLRPRILRRLLRQPITLVASSHSDLRCFTRRALHTLQLGQLDRARLRVILERRIGWARRARGPVPTVSTATLDALLVRYGGNLRAIEDDLYERFQRLETMYV